LKERETETETETETERETEVEKTGYSPKETEETEEKGTNLLPLSLHDFQTLLKEPQGLFPLM